MNTNRKSRVVTGMLLAAVLACVSAPVASAYGELKWVSSLGGPTSVPAGWVILQETPTQYQIENVAGATYGAKVVVTLHSAVPTGWIIDSMLGGTPGKRYLEYVTGAPYATQRTVELDSPVPAGWIIVPTLGWPAGTRLIECTLGATYQAQLRATLDSPVPANWVVTGADTTGRWLKYVAGAPFGTQVMVLLSSPVPANWMINQETATTRRLVCAVGATYGSTMMVILHSDVPANWVITREDTVNRDLMFVAGAAYQAKVTVTLSSPVWTNWVITQQTAFLRDLLFVGGAPQGTVITVTLSSPVPPGWIVISTAAAFRDIRFGSAGVGAPTNLKGVKGGGFIQLTWDAVAGAIGYNVKQRVFKTNPFITIAGNLRLNNYTDTNVSGGYTYYYIVTAIGSDGRESLPSAEIAVSPLVDPDAPLNVVATYGDRQVTISWTAVAGAVYYNVKRSTVSKGPYTTVANMTRSTSFVDGYVSNGTKYFYVVSSINSKNIESGPSLEVSAIPNIPPAAPANLVATPSDRTVYLTWIASSGPNLIGYAVYRHNASTQTFTMLPQSSTTQSTSFTDASAVNGQFYTYVVRAVNSSLQEGPSSNVATATPVGPPPPAAPAGLGAIGGDTVVSLSWPSVPGAMYYNVYRGTVRGGLHLIIAEPTGTSFTDTGLTNGVTYYYVVAAVDDSGAQSLDSVEAAATPAPSLSRPPAPNNLAAVGGIGEIDLTWDPIGNGVTYKIYRSPWAQGPWNSIGTSPAPSYEDHLVLFGEVYYYAVSAVNGIGEGNRSDPVSAAVGSD